MKKDRKMTAVSWAKKWSRDNVKALKYQFQGNQFDSDTWKLHASIAKDFMFCHAIQTQQLLNLRP